MKPIGERGATLVLVGIAIAALLSVVAVAVDIGMILNARSEAQRAADAAAMAGAGHLLFANEDDPGARAEAETFGEQNDVHSQAVEIDPDDDVEVDLGELKVRVTVHRDGVRGGPVGTWFASIFGVENVDISAVAAAKVVPAGSAGCTKPFIVPDRFADVDGNEIYNEDGGDWYDPEVTGYGTDFANGDGQGYDNDVGRLIIMKDGNSGGNADEEPHPGWYYPFDIPQTEEGLCSGGEEGQGAQCYEWAIKNCHPKIYEVGDIVVKENGAMVGPTKQGVEDLVALDPDAVWDESCSCVVGSKWGDNWAASPRYGIMMAFDPSIPYDPGKNELTITNIMGVWFEGVYGQGGPNQEVHGRLLTATGIGTDGPPAPMAMAVQLVE